MACVLITKTAAHLLPHEHALECSEKAWDCSVFCATNGSPIPRAIRGEEISGQQSGQYTAVFEGKKVRNIPFPSSL